jgi:hypothetical protein
MLRRALFPICLLLALGVSGLLPVDAHAEDEPAPAPPAEGAPAIPAPRPPAQVPPAERPQAKDEAPLPAAALKETVRPIFGLKVSNRTWRTVFKYEEYLWTDPATGKQWKGKRKIPNGQEVTLHIRIAAVDVPKEVMGTSATIIFPLVAETADTAFAVRTVPLRAGEYQFEKIVVHVPEYQLAREKGNWLRKIALDKLTANMFVRPRTVRFMDGTQEIYDQDPTVESFPALEPDGEPRSAIVHRALPTKRGKQGKVEPVVVQPFQGGRLTWVKPYYRRDGTYVRGHWRKGFRTGGPIDRR